MPAAVETYQGSALAGWDNLFLLLGAFAVVVVVLAIVRRPERRGSLFDRVVLRVPDGLERLTGIPGWAVSSFALALFGLLVAGEGFYADVSWHIALGRDEELFTAPHTAIIIGLVLIAASAMVAVLVATVARVDTTLRLGGLRVPWSALPLAALGGAAVTGFPLDELWHQQYGIDVTMWSPTHMLMILGASFTGMAAWLVLAEARSRPSDSRWARGLHVVAAIMTMLGLSASQGEFVFGVPQFQAIFLPILVSLAAGLGLVAIRLAHGPWWVSGIALFLAVIDPAGSAVADDGPVPTRRGGLYVASALVVELVARVLGTERRLRFAVVSGLGIGTVGLAAEWLWNQGAYQPWETSMLPDAVILSVVAAVAAALGGAALGSTLRGERPTAGGLRPGLLGGAAIATLVVLALPMPRAVGDAEADVRLDPTAEGTAVVHVEIDPSEVADARWFQVMTWQGGTLTVSDLEEREPGHYVSEHAHQITGLAKTVVRLQRGGEMMAIPVYLPADPEISEPEVPAVDRIGEPFVAEPEFLLREAEEGARWLAWVIYGLLALAVGLWLAAFAVAAHHIGDRARRRAEQAAVPVSAGAS